LNQLPCAKADAQLEEWLKIWFQQVQDKPAPNHLIDLLDRLEAEGGK